MDPDDFQHLLWTQDGVIARFQLLELGAQPHDIRRLLRRRDLNAIHPGVYVDHTGSPAWRQLAQAAVLAAWPAALAGRSALPTPAMETPIEVAVARSRWTPDLRGVRVRARSRFDDAVDWHKSPPRLKVEHAALQVAGRAADEAAAFQVLADACQARATSPGRLAEVLASYPRHARGRLLADLLGDLEAGACSVLERGYLQLVERAHGLPTAGRQVFDRVASGVCYRDVVYVAFGVVVELDGRAFHDNARARERDLDRDLAAAVEREAVTLRVGYGQVFTRGCATARSIGVILRRRGWTGEVMKCPTCPS
jgi:hypothetical protein